MNLRLAEAQSIRDFLNEHADKLGGRVLDLGCGKQPYRDIVENAGGHYVGHDQPSYPGTVVETKIGPSFSQIRRSGFDAIVMTQVWQYIYPWELIVLLESFAQGWLLKEGGWLLATGPTNWPVVEKDDLHRMTAVGAVSLLGAAGFPLVEVTERHHIEYGGERWSCGWAATARSVQ